MSINLSIKYIFIKPRNQIYAQYTLNQNNEIHILKYEDMYQFLGEYIKPPNTIKALNNLRNKIPFLVDVDNNEIINLSFNNEQEIEKLKKNIQKIDSDKAYQEIKKEKSFDKVIEDYSKIDIDDFNRRFLE